MPEYIVDPMPAQLPRDLVELLVQVETASVGHSRFWGFMHHSVGPLQRGRRVAGTAVTLAIPGPDSTLLHHALGLLRPGDILVVDRLGDDKYACWGGGVTIAAKAAGAAAGIVDGPCTDLAEIEESEFPMWCKGISPITTRIYNLAGLLNRPISCGGVPVHAGDAILADDSGVLVLGAAEARSVAEAALQRQRNWEDRQARAKSGEKLGDMSGASKMVLEAVSKG